MLRSRVVPLLLLYDGDLIKSIKFNDDIYIGDPINAVRIFNEKKVDELCIFDVGVSIDEYDIDYDLLKDIASQAKMPLTYGGGINSLESAKKIIKIGFEKVSLSYATYKDFDILRLLSEKLGSQSVCLCVDLKYSYEQKNHIVCFKRGTFETNLNYIDVCKNAEKIGIGEIIINNISRDGTMKGYDIDLAKKIRKNLKLPLSFVGGAESIEDMIELEKNVGVVGIVAGSMFVFKGVNKAVLLNYTKPK